MLREILSALALLPPFLVYTLLGVGVALENVVPPIPADTVVVLGGFLSSQGSVQVRWVFLATWGANVASALVVYAVGFRYGPRFFQRDLGQWLLRPKQLERLHVFYGRWGRLAIFLTRFLPGFRAIVPVFAGVTRQSFIPVALPLALASAIWYGFLIWVGAAAGRNMEAILAWIAGVNRTSWAVAIGLSVLVAYWWYRSRREGE
jgi:membrane protein DedA with SNARE-associated domain